MPVKYHPTQYQSGVLVEIIDKKNLVLKSDKGGIIRCSANKLHNRPDKAVKGKKAKERARHEMNMERLKKQEDITNMGRNK